MSIVMSRPLRLPLAVLSALALSLGAASGASAQSLDFGSARVAQGGTVVLEQPAPATDVAPQTEVSGGGGNQDIADLAPATQKLVDEIFAETNRRRAQAGVGPVRPNPKLQAIAQDWSERMAAEDRMYHNPQIRERMQEQFPRRWRMFGENVLQNWDGAGAAELVQQWMNSPPHRLNMLSAGHTDLGIGVAVAPSGKLYSTQNFAVLVR